MDFEIEQEMYIAPQIAEMERRQEIKRKKAEEVRLFCLLFRQKHGRKEK